MMISGEIRFIFIITLILKNLELNNAQKLINSNDIAQTMNHKSNSKKNIDLKKIEEDYFKTHPYNREIVQRFLPGFGTEYILLPGDEPNGEIKNGYYQTNPSNLAITRIDMNPGVEDSVHFILYTRKLQKNGIMITNPTKPPLDAYDPKKPTKLLTHGWESNGYTKSFQTMKDNFLTKYDCNVIMVDWSTIAENVIYPIPVQKTYKVGAYIAQLLDAFIKNGANPKDFHLVGHSLGAHVSGFAARQSKQGHIGRITGLDPAQPGFDNFAQFIHPILPLSEGGHLKATDAAFVDVIHTCAGFLGFKEPIGHADFYPNGGGPAQPGCGNIMSLVEGCSHGRSKELFSESILLKTPFQASKCRSDDYNIFSQGVGCDRLATIIPMGESCPRNARGIYYLETTSTPPFVIRN